MAKGLVVKSVVLTFAFLVASWSTPTAYLRAIMPADASDGLHEFQPAPGPGMSPLEWFIRNLQNAEQFHYKP